MVDNYIPTRAILFPSNLQYYFIQWLDKNEENSYQSRAIWRHAINDNKTFEAIFLSWLMGIFMRHSFLLYHTLNFHSYNIWCRYINSLVHGHDCDFWIQIGSNYAYCHNITVYWSLKTNEKYDMGMIEIIYHYRYVQCYL